MAESDIPLTRRRLLAATTLTLIAGRSPPVFAAAPIPLSLVLRPGKLSLRPGQPDSDVWTLDASGDPLRFKRGDELAVTFANQTDKPAALSWYGLDGVPSAEPLIERPPVPPGGTDRVTIPLRHAGTLLCEARLLGEPDGRPATSRAIVVGETAPPAVDRDEIILIEEWWVGSDGQPIAAGRDAGPATSLYTFNGRTAIDLPAKPNERLRFRFINCSYHNAIACKIDNLDVRVMAIDSQPSEAFLARDGVLAMAPGTRIDAFVDATTASGTTAAIWIAVAGRDPIQIGKIAIAGDPVRAAALPIPQPLPSNGLPEKLNLAGALRVDVPLGGPEWLVPPVMSAIARPAFRAKRGRTVVLALTNSAPAPAVFRMHGHHMRLLDKLDDGWKPFWLDTLAVAAGQTHRIAFAAENPGAYLLEWMTTDRASARMLRSYTVE